MEQEQESRLGQGAGRLSPDSVKASDVDTQHHAGQPLDDFGDEETERRIHDAPGAHIAALGPWLLLFPVVFLALATVWMIERRPSPTRAPQHPSPELDSVAGWSGSIVLDGIEEASLSQGTIHAVLAPLHADPERQEFERRTLQRRLALQDGEPWNLVLRFTPGEGAAPEGLDLALVAVVGPNGRLVPLPAEQPRAGEPSDPVRVLLAPPQGTLPPGAAIHLVLWGPDPGTEPRVTGLKLRGAVDAMLEVQLAARSVDNDTAHGTLARGAKRATVRAGRRSGREEGSVADVPRVEPIEGAPESTDAAVETNESWLEEGN